MEPFSKQILIPVSTHFFDGRPENDDLLSHSFAAHPACTFLHYRFDPEEPYGVRPSVADSDDWAHYWHSTSRYVAAHFLKGSIEEVLFLDVDEICDTERFLQWHAKKDQGFTAFRPAAYFYYLRASNQALTHPSYMLLVKREALFLEDILTPLERKGLFHAIRGEKQEHTLGLDSEPLFHHYSWVSPKAELIRKVESWGHHAERDWLAEIEKGECPFNLTYKQVEPFCDPLKYSKPEGRKTGSFSNVIEIERATLIKESMHHVL